MGALPFWDRQVGEQAKVRVVPVWSPNRKAIWVVSSKHADAVPATAGMCCLGRHDGTSRVRAWVSDDPGTWDVRGGTHEVACNVP